MDASQEQIYREFLRQVYLCSGLGRERMIEAVNLYFDDESTADVFRYGPYGKPSKKEGK